MGVTATCIYLEIEILRKNLEISQNNFVVTHGGSFAQEELQHKVRKKKDHCEELLGELVYHYDMNILDIFHEKITENTRKLTLAKWIDETTKIMIATTTFRIGINMKHVRL
ncbi:9209_t:CDS:2, partial [Racocetra persica]